MYVNNYKTEEQQLFKYYLNERQEQKIKNRKNGPPIPPIGIFFNFELTIVLQYKYANIIKFEIYVIFYETNYNILIYS